jgi:hypothetical protein
MCLGEGLAAARQRIAELERERDTARIEATDAKKRMWAIGKEADESDASLRRMRKALESIARMSIIAGAPDIGDFAVRALTSQPGGGRDGPGTASSYVEFISDAPTVAGGRVTTVCPPYQLTLSP